MFDWFSWGMGILQGVIGGAVSGLFLLYVVLPKMTARSARKTIEELKKDGELKPIIDKAKDIITRLEPVTKKLATAFKNLDLDKLQDDIQPFLELVRKINPKDVEELMQALKELTGTIKKSIEKPKIPEPIPELT